MEKVMVQPQTHFLLLTFPAQGHIKPALQFAKRLLRLGVKVTFATWISAYRRMTKAGQIPKSLNFAVFSDEFDDGNTVKDPTFYMNQLKTLGSQSLKETILSCAADGTPVTCLVYTLLLPWVAGVARGLNVPSALLWIQPASVLRIYYYYFNGYDKLIGGEDCNDPLWSIKLPGLPLLKSNDLPSFFLPSDVYSFALPLFKEQLEVLDLEDKPKVLVNSFDALEKEALKEIDGKLNLIPVGPLIPSTFLDGKDPFDTSFGGDFYDTSKEYVEWMNTKPEGSIVYISFGSIIRLSKKQKEAMAQGLLASRRPFLWVVINKDSNRKEGNEAEEEGEGEDEELSCKEELEELGLIVPWCSQLEVLSHPSLGCFVTHCGWNSTLESIACGVPMVAFPHWTDQTTNAKLLEDEWGTGVRVAANKEGVVEGDEIKKCIEMVMGVEEKGTEMRKNAKKWKDLAREAMKESGSSHMNLKAFVEEVNEKASKESKPESVI